MKKIILIIIAVLFVINVSSQVCIKLSKVQIENFIFDDESYYSEDYSCGPILTMKVLLSNNSRDTVRLNTSKFYFSFYYKKKEYRVIHTSWYCDKLDEIIELLPNSMIEINISTELLHKTGLKYSLKRDYTSLLLLIIPTYRIHYCHEGLDIFSSGIGEIEYFPHTLK